MFMVLGRVNSDPPPPLFCLKTRLNDEHIYLFIHIHITLVKFYNKYSGLF